MSFSLSNIIKGDKTIWAIIIMLSIISLLAVYSSTGSLAFRYQEGNLVYYLFRHGGLLLLGLFIIAIFQHIPFSVYNQLSYLLMLFTIPLLIFTLFKGTSINEASRWITLPGTGITFQSSDMAKFSLVVFIARFLAKYKDDNSSPTFKRDFKILVAIIFSICFLIFPSNFSTSAMIFVASLLMLFMGRLKFKYILSILGLGILIVSITLTIAFIFFPDKGRIATWKNRIETYFNSDKANVDETYQIEQSKIAIASGGFFGKGPGNSTQRNFLPHPYSDFIFSIIVEEYGFIGALVIILLYLTLLYRIGVIIQNVQTTFPAMLAIGLIIMLLLQAMINMGVATGIFPVTGQTLPLISMGGTSIIFTSISLGVILNISTLQKKENNKLEEKKNENKAEQEQQPITSETTENNKSNNEVYE